jgi:CheY-like chemotaxis protein
MDLRPFVWPVGILTILAMFHGQVAALIGRIDELKVDKTGVDIRIASSAANLGAALATQSTAPSQATRPVNLEGVVSAAAKAAQHVVGLSEATILWVDDYPNNNVYERASLAALGIKFDLAKNTSEAMQLLQQQNKNYSLIISDFKRRDDPQAGYTLLAAVKQLPHPPPVIIYSSSSSPEYEKDAIARGAFDETNDPVRLYDLTIKAIMEPQEATTV